MHEEWDEALPFEYGFIYLSEPWVHEALYENVQDIKIQARIQEYMYALFFYRTCLALAPKIRIESDSIRNEFQNASLERIHSDFVEMRIWKSHQTLSEEPGPQKFKQCQRGGVIFELYRRMPRKL